MDGIKRGRQVAGVPVVVERTASRTEQGGSRGRYNKKERFGKSGRGKSKGKFGGGKSFKGKKKKRY